jgi:hypothetical protein
VCHRGTKGEKSVGWDGDLNRGLELSARTDANIQARRRVFNAIFVRLDNCNKYLSIDRKSKLFDGG